jgi:hypothetical protein
MTTPEATTTGAQASGPRDGLRIFLIWLPLAIIVDVLIWFVWYPHFPPGRMTDQAQGQQFDIAVHLGLLCLRPHRLAAPPGR